MAKLIGSFGINEMRSKIYELNRANNIFRYRACGISKDSPLASQVQMSRPEREILLIILEAIEIRIENEPKEYFTEDLSLSDLASRTQYSKKTVLRSLKNLKIKGLLFSRETYIDNPDFYSGLITSNNRYYLTEKIVDFSDLTVIGRQQTQEWKYERSIKTTTPIDLIKRIFEKTDFEPSCYSKAGSSSKVHKDLLNKKSDLYERLKAGMITQEEFIEITEKTDEDLNTLKTNKTPFSRSKEAIILKFEKP